MIDIAKMESDIVERLKPLDPERIILFGSYAWGNPNDDSDIDLYIVTKDDILPLSFKEKNDIRLEVSRKIRDLQKTIPIDMIVHTKKMYDLFVKKNSSICKTIMDDGRKIYER